MTTATASPIQPAGRRRSGPASPSLVQSIGLVAEREVKMRLRSKTFLISTGILLLVILAGIVVGGFLAKNTASETTKVAVVGNAGAGLVDGKTFDVTEAADVAAAEALVKSGDVEAAIAPATDDNPTGVQVIFDSEASNTLIMQLSAQPQVTILDPDADGSAGFLLYIVSLGFGLVFFVSATTFGASIAQSVVEEKQTRVVEILMSAIPVKALLAGKVLGNSILAFGQILAIAALSVIGLTVTGQTELLAGLGTPVVWFVVFFVLGFILLAALFAAAGSLVSRQEDIGSTTTPITMLIMIPYFAVIFFNDNPVVMTIMSYVPFSAAVGMPVRLFVGSAQWWEPILSLLILAVTAALVILVGSRIYENSLLKMGGRVKLSEALKA
ncbi:ABC-2 type transport system permease protein [Plantibacter flavus]|uniref:ABC-2 type transport system permease protein n=1 Tax=Plantibacter flavus TaxID=150123 RepID=A0A3N2BZA1_9MICO|nr:MULTISPECIES: ABC transporter permease [Plantibacter]ROR80586.1 ABC-2 type transport system permease protein [Plantibacter flavus]SMG33085.1 ABC-2 type transport system permease protein [Plantibacter flavus]